jgi:hypothetical protein
MYIYMYRQDDYTDASTFAEEAYNCVAIAYNPVHQEVQAAAGNLIDCLIHLGNFYDAVYINVYFYRYVHIYIYLYI